MKKLTDSSVSIIIVNYNSLSLIENCIRSIQKFSTNSVSEIVIVSNSIEPEKKVAELKLLDKRILYINTGSNLGFAIANNIGAKKSSGEFLFFLNPDTILLNNAIDVLVDVFKRDIRTGVLGPAILDENKNIYPSVTGDFSFHVLLSLAIPLWNKITSPKNSKGFYIPDSSDDIDVIHGSAMFTSNKIFKSVGGMNEKFFLYCEERDFCLKTRKAGYKIQYTSKAKIQHIGGATSDPNNFIALEIIKHQSRKKLIEEHHSYLFRFNQICGVIGYFWRTLISILLRRKLKVRQFSKLLKWYLASYK